MLYELFSLIWLVAIIAMTIYIFRHMHRAALDRNRLLYELKEEVRKLRKSREAEHDGDASSKHQ
jgi:hypothetical protein